MNVIPTQDVWFDDAATTVAALAKTVTAEVERSDDRHRRGHRVGRKGPSKHPAFPNRGRRTAPSVGRRQRRFRNWHAHRLDERAPLMVTTLLRLVGVDVKRLAREAAITIVLAILGAFVAMLSLSFGVVALYLWLELKLGIFAALGILGGTSALLAGALFAIAFLRGSRKPRTHTDDALRAVADPVQASAAAIAQAADEAVNGAANVVRYGSRQQIAGTIATAALIGWVLGRRYKGPRDRRSRGRAVR